jgi:hypothetical protein
LYFDHCRLSKKPWTKAEDEALLALQARLGSKWADIGMVYLVGFTSIVLYHGTTHTPASSAILTLYFHLGYWDDYNREATPESVGE